MKGGRGFVVLITVLLLVLFAIDNRQPKTFQWDATFAHNDRQPFGCYVLDSVLSQWMPGRYTAENITFYQLAQKKAGRPRGIVCVKEAFDLSETDWKYAKLLAQQGCNILLAGKSEGQHALPKDMKTSIGSGVFSLDNLKGYAKQGGNYKTIYWMGDSLRYRAEAYTYYPSVCLGVFYHWDKQRCEILANMGDPKIKRLELQPVALKMKYGKGSIILCSTPLIFTNYGILDRQNGRYICRMMTQLGNGPIVRMDELADEMASGGQLSVFSYLLTQEPLRWALYLTLLAVVLYMVFTARRRQRAIPVVEEPRNRSLEYAKLIGTLYYQRHDNTDLVRKKYLYFGDELRRTAHIDIDDPEHETDNCKLLAERTGMKQAETEGQLASIRMALADGRPMSNEAMQHCIDMMDNMMKNL
jgi:hypothetical protein